MCLIKSRVLKTWFLLCRNRVFKTRDLCRHFKPSQQFTASAKRVSKTRFLIRSWVLETQDAIFLKTFKRCLTYYIELPHTATLQIPTQTKPKQTHFHSPSKNVNHWPLISTILIHTHTLLGCSKIDTDQGGPKFQIIIMVCHCYS